jgi:DNA polymerase-3 subunit alpha
MNYLWLDIETTGLNEKKNDIIQLACIPVINGVVQKSFNEFCQPTNWQAVEQEALDIHGITLEQLYTFQSQEDMIEKFVNYIKSFGVKFTIAGFNVSFDKRFLSATFSKLNKTSDFFRMFSIDIHCTYRRATKVKSQILSKSLKLEALANLYGIEIQAHDALSDIEATIKVDKVISGLLNEDDTVYTPDINIDDIKINVGFPEMAQLNVHSQYNMIDGVPLPEEWYKWAADNDIPGISVVDPGSGISLFNSIRNKEATVAVSGLGIYVIPDEELVLEMLTNEKPKPFLLSAWAVNNAGYDNLVKLASLGHDAAEEINGIVTPLLTMDQVRQHKEGVLFGSANIKGPIGQAVQSGDAEFAERRFLELQKELNLILEFNPVDITRVFDGKIGFRNVIKNGLIPDGNLNKAYNNFLFSLYQKHGADCIPVTGACFIDPEDKLVQDCLSKNAHKDSAHKFESYHIKDTNQVFKELKVHLGDRLTEEIFNSWVQKTLEITDEAKNISVEHEFHLPKVDIPSHIKDRSSDYDKQTYYVMMEKIKKHGRWKDDPVYIERFKKELDVIMNNDTMNFIPYFLVYEDVSEFSRNAGCLQSIGRGSAGGCLISYYLQIIHVDPVEADLPFERFLSHARIRAGSWPDIDMDISRTARPLVMSYLKEKYGLGFAQISTFSTMKTKNAIKDAMMAVYGRNRNDFEIDAVCKTIPDSPQGVEEKDFLYGYTDKEGVKHEGEFETNEMLQNFFQTYPEVKKLVDKLLGVVRGWSRHASAFVISTIDLQSGRVPTLSMYDSGMGESIHVTQFNAKMAEQSGLVKADLLGLNTMSMVSDCVALVKNKVDYLKQNDNGVALIYRLPEDESVYADFIRKKTDSSFQFNTNVVKNAVPQFMPTERGHLSIMTALLRPGAMDAEIEPGVSATQWYMDVRMGKRKPTYIHDDLIPILEETYGIIVYQEQVMKILVDICGYTLEETDRIRDAIAKKKHEVMMKAFDRIREGTSKKGWTQEQQDALCNTIMAFSRYSFNRSHSHCYAELGYITMYLKHHHPLEWWAAVLNNEGSEDKIRAFVSLLGDIVKPPSLKNPSNEFKVQGEYLVAPISAIKRVGPASVNELVKKGPFVDLDDYVKRVDHRKVNKGVVEAIVKARAADCLMDDTLTTYADQKLDFLCRYNDLRGGKIAWKEEVKDIDPLKVFFMEKEFNKTFNKHLLSDKDVVTYLKSKWPALVETGRKGIPMLMGGVPVLNNLKVAEGLVQQEHKKEVGMIMVFEGSNIRKGISKRTGKDYHMLNIRLSDGYSNVECVDWNRKKPLRFAENSVVYVRGTLKEGWKLPVSINLKEIEEIK